LNSATLRDGLPGRIPTHSNEPNCGLRGWAIIIIICVVVLLVRVAWYITSQSFAEGDRKSLMQGLGIGLAGIGVAAVAIYAGPIAVVVGLGATVVYVLSKLDAS
jgi:hypothetical protein